MIVGRKIAVVGFLLVTPLVASAQAPEIRPDFGHAVQVIDGADLTRTVVVDGKPLYVDHDDAFVAVQGMYQSEGRSYALITESSGGSACPAMYRAISLDGSKPVATSQFGTCSDIPKVTATGGNLIVTMPAMNGKGMVTYTVAGAQVSASNAAIRYGHQGPALSAGMDLAEMITGKPISDAMKMQAVVQAVRRLVGDARAQTVIDYAAGGPGTSFEARGNFVVATACLAHACNTNQAAVAFDHHGNVWVKLRVNNAMSLFGNPPAPVRSALLSS